MNQDERSDIEMRCRLMLDVCESAPSAVVLVMSFICEYDDDKFMDDVYEKSEGANDSFRDAMISYMDDDQLMKLYKELMSIYKEQPRDYKLSWVK